jgi:hypothetical protein
MEGIRIPALPRRLEENRDFCGDDWFEEVDRLRVESRRQAMKTGMKAAVVMLAMLVASGAAYAQDPGADAAAQAQIAAEQTQASAQQAMSDASITAEQAQLNIDQMTADPGDPGAALQIQMEQSQIDSEQAMEQAEMASQQAQIDAQQAMLAAQIPN